MPQFRVLRPYIADRICHAALHYTDTLGVRDGLSRTCLPGKVEEQENEMSTKCETPKLLPWLARKAGISERRARSLWFNAERWAERHADGGSSAYYKLAIDRLLEGVAAESLREDAASFGWRPWARAQVCFWSLSMHAAQKAAVITTRGWRLLALTTGQQLPG